MEYKFINKETEYKEEEETNATTIDGRIFLDKEDLINLADDLEFEISVLAVFHCVEMYYGECHGIAAWLKKSNVKLSATLFNQESLCKKVGARKGNKQLIVLAEKSTYEKPVFTLLFFDNGSVEVSNNLEDFKLPYN